jgi:hypothetical protein
MDRGGTPLDSGRQLGAAQAISNGEVNSDFSEAEVRGGIWIKTCVPYQNRIPCTLHTNT